MSAFEVEDTINEFLKSLGVTIGQPFADIPGSNPLLRYKHLNHMNVGTTIVLDGRFILIWGRIGFLPKQNIAPLLRRLLNLNSKMSGPYFSIPDDGGIMLSIMRQQDGLDLVEFKWMLDQISSMYWQFAAGLAQEFQLPQQPG